LYDNERNVSDMGLTQNVLSSNKKHGFNTSCLLHLLLFPR